MGRHQAPGLVATVLLAAAAASPVHAARPLATGVASVNEVGECELGLGRQSLRAPGERGWQAGGELECGVVEGLQLSLAYERGRVGPGRFEEAEFGAKGWLWRGQGDNAPRLALAAEFNGGRADGSGWQHEASEVEVLGLLPLKWVLLHANLGHVRPRGGGPTVTSWALAAEARPLQAAGLGWAPLAEVYGDDRGERWTRLGLRATVVPGRLHLDLSQARGHGEERQRSWELGARVEF
jgi:hypothetical protein